jgi:hypothetical protein
VEPSRSELLDSGDDPAAKPAAAKKKAQQPGRPGPPAEIRGVHVTMALASLPGKLDEYTETLGLNTIELDVKDENGEVPITGWPRRWPSRSARRSGTTIP